MDSARGDGAFPNHQTLPNSVARRVGGDGGFSCLSPTEGPVPFLFGLSFWPLFFFLSIPLATPWRLTLRHRPAVTAYAPQWTSSPALFVFQLPFLQRRGIDISKKTDDLEWMMSTRLTSTGEGV